MTPRLWDKGEPLDERVLRYTAGEDHAPRRPPRPLRRRAPRSPTPRCSTRRAALRGGPRRHPRGAGGARRGARGGRVADRRSRTRTCIPRSRRRLTARIGEAGGRASISAARATIRCSPRCASTCATPSPRSPPAPARWPARSTSWPRARRRRRSPATPTCSRRCRARCRSGPAASPPSCATTPQGSRPCARRDRQESARLGRRLRRAAAADRPRGDTRASLGFAEIQEPVTAVQLSRGKAEAQVLFEIALLMQDLGRLAADLVLFDTRSSPSSSCRRE